MKRVYNKKKIKVDMVWGLGLEHEMLYTTTLDATQKLKHVVQSRRVVEASNIIKIGKTFDVLDAALGIKLPRLYERAAGPLTCVELNNDLMFDPYVGFCKKHGEEEIIKMLINVGLEDLDIAVAMIAPYIAPGSFEGIFFALTDASNNDDVYTIVQKEFLRLAPMEVSRVFRSFYVDDVDASSYRVLMAKVLVGSSDIHQYLEHLFSTLERMLRPELVIDARTGAHMHGDMRVGVPEAHLTYIPTGSQHHSSKKHERVKAVSRQQPLFMARGSKKKKRMLIAAVILLHQIQVDLTREAWTDVDGPFVEIKTLKHKNATVTSIIQEINRKEALTKESVESIVKGPCRLLEHSCYSDLLFFDPYQTIDNKYPDIVNVMPVPEKYYGGSFHYWFTLPYDKNSLLRNDFAHDHVKFAHMLQWMEPLLLSLCGGDPTSIGRGASFAPRAAYRSIVNKVGGVGSTDTCELFNVITNAVPKKYPLVYFTSDESFVSTFTKEVRTEPDLSVLNSNTNTAIYVDLEDGSTIPVRGCEEVGREPRDGRLVGSSKDNPLPPTLESHIVLPRMSKTPHNQLLRIAYSALYAVKDGSNIRIMSTWCDALRLNLRPFWQAYPVLVGDVMKLRFYNSTNGKISMTAPFKDKALISEPKLSGFEFRLMDNMTLKNIEPLMNLFVLVAAASKEANDLNHRSCENVQLNTHWSKTVADVFVKGRFSVPNHKYVTKVLAMMSLSDPERLKNKDCFEVLNEICDDLFDKYRDHPWVHMMAPKLAQSKKGFYPRLVDSNLEAFMEGFEVMLMERPDIKIVIEKLQHFNQKSDGDILSSLGREFVYDVPYISKWLEMKRNKL